MTSGHRSQRVIRGESKPEWGRSQFIAVVLLGVLLASIVAMTSADSPWLHGEGDHPSAPPAVGEVLAFAAAAGLSVLVGLAWIGTPQRSRNRRQPHPEGGADADELGTSLRMGLLTLIGGLIVIICVTAVFWFLLGEADVAAPPPEGLTTGADTGVPPPPAGPRASVTPTFRWFVLGLVASFVVVFPLGLLARHRLRAPNTEQPALAEPRELVGRAVGDSIDQIERDPDPRRAIIRAYARMEGAFDDAGIPRRPYEAPFEYLGRALRGLRVGAPTARGLAALFERARFSQHAVNPETKDAALGALREIEQQLKEPPA